MSPALKFINHSIDDYAMNVTYDPRDGTGTVVYNLSVIKKEDLEYAVSIMKDAYKAGICFSGFVRFFEAGERVADYRVPADSVAIATVCSTTLDGILLKRGIPENPIGGGVVEVERRIPRRFIHMILYEHTTIDPLQVLISQEITSITDVMRRGSGNILANVRECHMEAESLLGEVLDDLSAHGFSGTLEVGLPNSPILGVAVDPQYLGIAAVGGTNQMAAIKERGYPVVTQAMKGLIDVQTLAFIMDY